MDKDTKEFIVIMLIWSVIFFPMYFLNVDLFGIKFGDFTNQFGITFADFTNQFFTCLVKILTFNPNC